MQTITNNLIYILLADDDEDDRFFFKEALLEINGDAIVQTIGDGEQLMNYLTKKETILPQIIFLDLNMPRKGGIECLKEIRNNGVLKDLTIAIYSTSFSERDIEETFNAGANIYIRKPNDFNSLRKMMSSIVGIDWNNHEKNLNMENYLLRYD